MARFPIQRSRDLSRGEVTWDPFERMREWMQMEPLARLRAMAPGGEEWTLAPDFDVKETKDGYIFKADVPGVKEEDVEISLTGNQLTVSGKREEEKREEGERYYTYERRHGSFSRSFSLPEGVDSDHIQAELKDGVLSLMLPKRPEVQAKRITLGGEKKQGKVKA
ncbi:Hsp20/alpha crystallin family protein [Myxococcus sp. RHSTA-1-4]|uniref:Hsp20/alpha crystallin family protein n=1 Tax=Myxococcus sp. RHSTA-1-4 TaxID=2874601 RepID=UPI001CBC01CE|nr:Hsp20/alpha crystallin family protein [Myxococcus sp. RHSTA-1-4]MBZ4420250.1 Hsp20/alpha crystallin family protein [Myxococcus sp. RHSTA-1-4]